MRVRAIGCGAAALLGLAACGGSTTTVMQTPAAASTPVQTVTEVVKTQTQTAPTRIVTQTTPAPAPATPVPASSTSLGACDQNISVNSSTSCAFADNVFNQYAINVQQGGAGSYQLYAYSPSTGQGYSEDCQLNSETQVVDCSHGGDLVQFPEWAAAVYQTH